MPTYQYRCGDCGHDLEAVQSFSDDALVDCPACGKPALRKVFGNVGVVFKGSGFYRNDSRKDAAKGAKKKAPDKSSSDSGTSTSASDGGTGTAAKSASKDTPTKPTTSSPSGGTSS